VSVADSQGSGSISGSALCLTIENDSYPDRFCDAAKEKNREWNYGDLVARHRMRKPEISNFETSKL
jgi:hypothetical protein